MTLARLTCLVATALVLLPVSAATAAAQTATCRKTDKAETGLQGEMTQAEVDSGANAKPINCNVDLVGQYQGEGASWQLTAWKNCAYFDQRKGTNLANPGTVVMDVSNPSKPVPTAYLQDPAMLDPWESLKVNPQRQLLAADQGTYGSPGPGFSIYDISADCKHPVLKSSVNISGSLGHTGQWAPDGNTYYITTIAQTSAAMVAVDTKDAANPQPLLLYTAPSNISASFHDLEFSKDGNIAYVGGIGGFGGSAANGLIILDVSDIQSRKANPQVRVLSTLTWDDGSIVSQNALPVTIAGKQYILYTDEAGSASISGTCTANKSGQGFPRLIDVSDPKNPTTVAKLMMQIAAPENCAQSIALKMTPTTQTFGYSCHYCAVDDVDNAKIAACNCFAAGLRIWDISNPAAPVEKGYYKSPAQGTKIFPGSQYGSGGGFGPPASFSRPIDWASSKPSFPKDRGMTSGDIWTTSQDNGFEVVHYAAAGGGGCSTGGGAFGALGVALAFFLQRRRRRGSNG